MAINKKPIATASALLALAAVATAVYAHKEEHTAEQMAAFNEVRNFRGT